MAQPSPPVRRYPYRSVAALEDVIAAQLAVLYELAEMRQAVTDPRTKRYLRDQERRAGAVHTWLITLREEMRHGPPEHKD